MLSMVVISAFEATQNLITTSWRIASLQSLFAPVFEGCDIDSEAYRAIIPSLVLQPLVENATRNGVRKRTRSGAMQVSVTI